MLNQTRPRPVPVTPEEPDYARLDHLVWPIVRCKEMLQNLQDIEAFTGRTSEIDALRASLVEKVHTLAEEVMKWNP